MLRRCMLGVLIGMAAGVALADPPPLEPQANGSREAAAWDDAHMRSRYQETPRTARPRIIGESGYGALESGSAQTRDEVAQELEFTTQRQWVQGPLGKGNRSASNPPAARGPSSISRGSALRAAAQSSRHRR